MASSVALQPPFPEEPHQPDRLLEHLAANVRRRPSLAEHVLVEVLARPDAEEEPSGKHRRGGRGGLRDDRRMQSQDRARHAGADHEPLGLRGDGA